MADLDFTVAPEDEEVMEEEAAELAAPAQPLAQDDLRNTILKKKGRGFTERDEEPGSNIRYEEAPGAGSGGGAAKSIEVRKRLRCVGGCCSAADRGNRTVQAAASAARCLCDTPQQQPVFLPLLLTMAAGRKRAVQK